MKKLRKTVTALLALVMLLSVFAMPAMAAGAAHDHACESQSEIQPRVPYTTCIYCGGAAKRVHFYYNNNGELICEEFECQKCGKTFTIVPLP